MAHEALRLGVRESGNQNAMDENNLENTTMKTSRRAGFPLCLATLGLLIVGAGFPMRAIAWQPTPPEASSLASEPSSPETTEEAPTSALVEKQKPELERPTTWGEPTEVRVGIYVLDVDEVNSADQTFSASVYYDSRWNSPVLRHEGSGRQR